MPDADPIPPKLSPSAARMVRQVETRQTRSERAQKHRADIWKMVGIFGLIGWSVALPTLLGVALGAWIDHRWPANWSWTLTLMAIGLVLGCTNAWIRIRKEVS